MAEFKSQYQSLGFYVDGEFIKFNGGRFVTDDAKTIEVLSKITDAVRVDEPKAAVPKAEEKPAKAKSANKPSAK